MVNIENYIIRDTASCKEAMKAIDKNYIKILFIVDDDDVLEATLTDGDIRRYLVSGGLLDDYVIHAGNKHPRVASDYSEAKSLYDKKSYIAIPIVENGKLVDIYFGDKRTIKYKPITDLRVIINAGGRGTRLDPFTKVLPKPLIPVGDLPIIEHIMQEFNKYSLSSFDIIVNYKKELIKTYFKESENKYHIIWHDEEKPLGTGGGLSLLRRDLTKTFFFTNCDILITADYESIVRHHKNSGNVITMVCAYKSICIPYGVVQMGKSGVIEKMEEKPDISFLTNTGMYIVEPEALNYIKDDTQIGFPDVVKMVKESGGKVGVYPISEFEWMDMGQLDELEKMRIRLYGK